MEREHIISTALATRTARNTSTVPWNPRTGSKVPAARAQTAPQAWRQEDVALPVPGRVLISERPPEAVDRSGFGHWEADGVIRVECNLHTEMKRRIRFLMTRVISDKTADESVGGGIVDGNTIQSTHSKRFIRLLRSIIVLTAALGSVTFRGFVYGTRATDA